MPQIRLMNGSGRVAKNKDLVKLHATKKNAFDLAKIGDSGIIGQTTQVTKLGAWCLINIIGTISWDDIVDRPEIRNNPKITVNEYPPSSPKVNDIWIEITQT